MAQHVVGQYKEIGCVEEATGRLEPVSACGVLALSSATISALAALKRKHSMDGNLGFLLPVWLLGAPLAFALIEWSRTPTPRVIVR